MQQPGGIQQPSGGFQQPAGMQPSGGIMQQPGGMMQPWGQGYCGDNKCDSIEQQTGGCPQDCQ